MANVIRICARYNNLEIIEDAYGISLRPLLTFAEMVYKEDRYEPFMPKINSEDESKIFPEEIRQIAKMNQAISIIQFKLEAEIIQEQTSDDSDNQDMRPQSDISLKEMLNRIGVERK